MSLTLLSDWHNPMDIDAKADNGSGTRSIVASWEFETNCNDSATQTIPNSGSFADGTMFASSIGFA